MGVVIKLYAESHITSYSDSRSVLFSLVMGV